MGKASKLASKFFPSGQKLSCPTRNIRELTDYAPCSLGNAREEHSGFPGPVPTSSCAGGLNLDPTDQTPTPKLPKEQGVILVTEHNAQVNAGFVVLRGSNHAPPLLEADWQGIPLGPGDLQDQAIANIGRAWYLPTGNLSPKWSGMGGMTGI